MVKMNGIAGSYSLTSKGEPTAIVPALGPGQDSSNDSNSPDAAASAVPADPLHKEKFQLTISEEAVVKAVEKANKAIMGPPKRFEYTVHKGSNIFTVKVLNAETNEVIREFPPEKMLELVDKLQELTGAIIDEKR